jgi:hypothetical protein
MDMLRDLRKKVAKKLGVPPCCFQEPSLGYGIKISYIAGRS